MYKENHYIELSLHGLIKINLNDKEKVMDEISDLISNLFKSRDIIKIDTDITSISDNDIMLSLYSLNKEDYQ